MAPVVVEGVVFDLDATLVNLGGFVEWKEAHRRAVEAYIECGCPEDLIHRCSEKGLFSMLNLVRDELSKTLPSSEVERIQLNAYRASSPARPRAWPSATSCQSAYLPWSG